eukprot:TRINITY_DN58785_c0_g1_i1.p1 TRINITY_DN58785_c0_g1~~TRINITY_DN58785_c0_g1_i1.p1  ORF type:complete len:361 (-),score=83.60 TRINITY_DN58785_c0_g1_i1:139-1176(-)
MRAAAAAAAAATVALPRGLVLAAADDPAASQDPILLSSDVLRPLCFGSDDAAALAQRERCCKDDGGYPGCWDTFFTAERCCRGADSDFRAHARGIRERLLACMREDAAATVTADATFYAFSAVQEHGRVVRCLAKQARVAFDFFLGSGGALRLLAEGLQGRTGARAVSFEHTVPPKALALLEHFGLHVARSPHKPGALEALAAEEGPLLTVVEGMALRLPPANFTDGRSLVVKRSGVSSLALRRSPLVRICAAGLRPDLVVLDVQGPVVHEWLAVEEYCRPRTVFIYNTNLPGHAGWVRDKLLMRGDWAEILTGVIADPFAAGHARDIIAARRWTVLIRDTSGGL